MVALPSDVAAGVPGRDPLSGARLECMSWNFEKCLGGTFCQVPCLGVCVAGPEAKPK